MSDERLVFMLKVMVFPSVITLMGYIISMSLYVLVFRVIKLVSRYNTLTEDSRGRLDIKASMVSASIALVIAISVSSLCGYIIFK